MKIALISDIHANLPALQSTMADVRSREIDAIYHLGDLVGYAPWPNEVAELIQSERIPGVAGNYDSTVATDYKHCGCKYEDPHQEELSHLSYAWTRAHVNATTKRFLGSLPFRIDIRPLGGHVSGPTITLLHGNQTLNTVYTTQDRPDSFLAKMGEAVGARAGDVVCVGHTHKPWHRIVGDVSFVNTGSVGRPKDGDWRAGYVLLEVTPQQTTVEFVRVEYDVEAAARGILASELPHEFADYLRTGGAQPAVTAEPTR